MTDAAFKACYSDWRVIKGRKVVQIVFETPLEQADAAYKALGGMPIAASEVWCGIARLGAATPKQPESKSPAQIAGYLCTLPSFHKFLQQKFYDTWWDNREHTISDENAAAHCIYDICTVASRSELTNENAEWHALHLAFKLWEQHPELGGA